MDLLLHICCAPCSIFSWDYFSGLGYNLLGYYYNPNIHPYREYSRRMTALSTFMQTEKRSVIYHEEYPMEEFLHRIMNAGNNERCIKCYDMRLGETARYAKEVGIGYFSTTLLLSPYQKHELLQETGEKVARHYGLHFLYKDLRFGFRESMQKAREKDIYRQGYCGCIFSEKERYYKRGVKE